MRFCIINAGNTDNFKYSCWFLQNLSEWLSFGKSLSYITILCSYFTRTCFGEYLGKRPYEQPSKKACWQLDSVFNSWINWMDHSWPTPSALDWLAGEKPMIKSVQFLLNFFSRGAMGHSMDTHIQYLSHNCSVIFACNVGIWVAFGRSW